MIKSSAISAAFPTQPQLALTHPYVIITMIFLLSFASTSIGKADLILGNFAGASNDNGFSPSFEKDAGYSIGFKVGAQNLILSSVDFRIRSNMVTGVANLELRSDNSGMPASSALALLGSQSVTTSFNTITFTPTGVITLSAGQVYWLTLGTNLSSPDGIILGASDSANPPSGLFATIDPLNFLRTGNFGDQNINISGLFSTPTFAINGSIAAVPEPTSLMLTMIALLSGWKLRRRVSFKV